MRESHFAHYDGNSSKACELYYPGEGLLKNPSPSQAPSSAPPLGPLRQGFGNPELIWRSDQPLPTSLYLRLPSRAGGLAVDLRVVSRSTSQFRGKDLTRPAFASLRLQVPPAEFATLPPDSALDSLVNETISTFRFSGNYFRATTEGGVLEHPNSALELGEQYWLVTQSPLREPAPQTLLIEEKRSDRAWHAYRISLPETGEETNDDLRELSAYLGRGVVQSRPKVHIVWPTPDRIDLDGVPVFDTSVSEIIVRSPLGVPHCLMSDAQLVKGEALSQDLFRIQLGGEPLDCVLGVLRGTFRRLRFEPCQIFHPASVMLMLDGQNVELFATNASELFADAATVSIEVPSNRLWRRVKINGTALRPIPNEAEVVVQGSPNSITVGSFGGVSRPNLSDDDNNEPRWYSSAERLVVQRFGARGLERLRQIRNKSDLVRWALECDALALLPKLLTLKSASEVARGVP